MRNPKGKVIRWPLAWLICLAVLPGACAPPPTPPALIPITVQLAWTHQAQFAGMYAADQKGYYAAEGLDVNLVQGGANIDKLAPVLDGTAQFSTASADELILARSEGKPLQAVATIFRRSPAVFISLAEKGITRPQDFVGKTISVPANILLSLRALMDKLGIAPDQYKIVTLPSDLTRFASGDPPVWGVYTIGFVVAIQKAGYKLNIIYPDDYGIHFYADTLFTTDNLISTNPDLVRRFLRATLKGWSYAVENPAEVPAMVQKYKPEADASIELARMTASLQLINTGEDYIGWMKPEVWTYMEQTLRAQGIVTAPLDVPQVYTMQFLEEIYK
jgi:NitT/TauT family transport system substrate-binding protein